MLGLHENHENHEVHGNHFMVILGAFHGNHLLVILGACVEVGLWSSRVVAWRPDRGTSLIRNTHPHRITIGPYA